MKERFGDGVVVAVALAAHAGLYAIMLQKLMKLIAGIVTALVGMQDHPRIWNSASHSSPESIYNQVLGQASAYRPADHKDLSDNLATTDIQNHRQIQPTLFCPEVGNIGAQPPHWWRGRLQTHG